MDPITQVLRTRPGALRDILKACGGWSFRSKEWALPLWQEATQSHKYAFLSKRTYHWRMCLVGARRGRRGWLAELLLSSPTLCSYPQPERPLQLAKLIQSGETGEWPELQMVCAEESEILRQRLAGYPSPLLLDTSHGWPYEQGHPEAVPNGTPLHASSRMPLKARMEGSVQFCTPEEGGSRLNPSLAHQIERDLESSRGTASKAANIAREDGVITVITQAPNVTPFLRPWRGPRGDGGAA